HKYGWLMEFLGNIKNYEANTRDTVKMALLARERLFAVAEQENIQFDLEKRGILHFYHGKLDYEVATRVNTLLINGGLERIAITPDEIKSIEPSLKGEYYGGFYCPGDATGDIHKFTKGLAEASEKYGVKYMFGMEVTDIKHHAKGVTVLYHASNENMLLDAAPVESLVVDYVGVNRGVASYHVTNLLGDRVDVYPVNRYSITLDSHDEHSSKNAAWDTPLDECASFVSTRLGGDRLHVAANAEFN